MSRKVISNKEMGFVRETMDPFLFCVHHLDLYPAGNEVMGPTEPLYGSTLALILMKEMTGKCTTEKLCPVFLHTPIEDLRQSQLS